MTSENIVEDLLTKMKSAKGNVLLLKRLLDDLKTMSGLMIDGYVGDYPTFIEPVYVAPGIKIGDTVLLGPNVLVAKGCSLGDFTELNNVILNENVKTGKKTKLKGCVVDENVELPLEFEAKNSYITAQAGNIEIIPLE